MLYAMFASVSVLALRLLSPPAPVSKDCACSIVPSDPACV